TAANHHKRQAQRLTQGSYTTRNDTNSEPTIGVLQTSFCNSLSSFFISHDLPFLRRNDFIFLFQSTDHPFNRILEVLHTDGSFILPGGDQGCFVTYIGDLRTCKARSLCR